MGNSQDTFKRVEKKYMLDTLQYSKLLEKLDGIMVEDAFGLHTIGNIYYDTEDYSLIRASIDKPVYKEKIRLRSYGKPRADKKVFVELKKKYKGIVYKRRVQMTLREARDYLGPQRKHPEKTSQILKELDWTLDFYHPVPKVFIGYERSAFYCKENADLRITFDTNLRWRTTLLDLEVGTWGSPLMEDGFVLMEIKIPGSIPLWLSRTLAELRIYPKTFSKYGTCYEKYLIREMKEDRKYA